MKKILRFDPAWVIFFTVVATLIALNFMDDEQSRNTLAGMILLGVALLFFGAILLRTVMDRIG